MTAPRIPRARPAVASTPALAQGLRLLAFRLLPLLAVSIALLALAAALAGCGGGPDEDDGRHELPGPVDCRARPELCV